MNSIRGVSPSFFYHLFALGKLDTSRLVWIDYAKGVAIAMIVFRHVVIGLYLQPDIAVSHEFYDAVRQIGFTFRMPLYFMLSGIFFSRSFAKRGMGGYAVHKFDTIMYPYFVWYLILMGFQYILSGYSNAQLNTLDDFMKIFYNPWGHWWFLYVLFWVSVSYMLLKWIFRGSLTVLLVLGIVFYFLAAYLGDLYVLDDALELFVFFVFGDCIASIATSEEQLHKYSRWSVLAPVMLLAIVGEGLLFGALREHAFANLFFAFIGIIAASLLCVRLSTVQSKSLRILRLIGQHSLYIYLLHVLVNGAVRTILFKVLGVTHLWVIISLGFVCALFGPIIIYRIFTYLNATFLFYPTFKHRAQASKS